MWSEQEYDGDMCAEKTALKYIEKISKCFYGNVYLVTASVDVGQANKIRSKRDCYGKKKNFAILKIIAMKLKWKWVKLDLCHC